MHLSSRHGGQIYTSDVAYTGRHLATPNYFYKFHVVLAAPFLWNCIWKLKFKISPTVKKDSTKIVRKLKRITCRPCESWNECSAFITCCYVLALKHDKKPFIIHASKHVHVLFNKLAIVCSTTQLKLITSTWPRIAK